MALRRTGHKPLPEPMMVSLLTHICVTRPQWVNSCSMLQYSSLWPDACLVPGDIGTSATRDDVTGKTYIVYPKKYAHGFVVLCFVVVMQSFIMNSHEVFIHIHQGCFAGTGAIVRLPQCQWSKPDGYGKISQCITTTKHSKTKTVRIFLGIYCIWRVQSKTLLASS